MKLESPLPKDIRKLRVNNTLHGRSVWRKQNVRGHNVIHGYDSPGKGDGLDLFVPHGTPVRACHDGRITRIAEPLGRLGCVYVEGSKVFTAYAHLHVRECLKLRDIISAGTLLGWVNGKIIHNPHLHLEIWENGKSVSAKSAKVLQDKFATRFN